jgi:hypothetical protein
MSQAPEPPTHLPYNKDKSFIACEPSDSTLFDTARIRYQFSRDLPVSPDVLFDIFEDPESWPKWATGIGSVEWTSPKPYQVGTTRTVRFWGGAEVYEEFIAWKRGKEMSFVFYGTSELIWTRFGEHYSVEPREGGCRLTWTVAYDPAGGFGRVHGLIGGVMRFNLGSYLWRLERYCRRI